MNNYKEDLKKKEKYVGGLINLIANYVIDNQMTEKEMDESINKVREIFYSDGIIRRS
jgi:hypothetical protein